MNKLRLRSVLFVPGDRINAIIKARTLPADAVILDLEDAVGIQNKDNARELVVDFLGKLQQETTMKVQNQEPIRKQRVVVRVNCPFTTDWGIHDIKALRQLRNIDAVLLPKVQDESHIIRTADHLRQNTPASANNRIPPLWAMIETTKGVINSDRIAAAEACTTLVFGSNDLSKELQVPLTSDRLPLLYSMSKVVLSGRAYDKMVIDGVHMKIDDEVGLAAVCEQGKSLGFDGKSLIHPNQINICNRIFSPTPDDVAWAHQVIKAFNEATSNGKGVCVVRGKLVESLHVEQAHAILQKSSLE